MEAYYRIYELQWTPDAEQEARFRRTLRNTLAILLLLSLLIPWLPMPERSPEDIPEIPQRFARLLLERKVLPPPPPAPVVRNEPEPVGEQMAREQPKPVEAPPKVVPDRVEKVRERASKAGLLPFAEALADLRSNEAVASVISNSQLSQGSGIAKRTQRAVITSKVAGGSDGIRTSGFSRDTGGGGLNGRDTTTVVSTIGVGGGGGGGSGRGGAAGRSLEEIEMVFDRNKGAIFALYNRALRKDPALQGKLVLRLTISPDGQVTFCEVVSSELGDAELERKLVMRVKMFRFDAKDVAPFTATKPIDFFPA
ncbi:MAG: AgmX/PglI C-terminal domain-containing protein [Gammaproteobacteria bacterium]